VVLDFATRRVQATWLVPGGGSLDLGNVRADGRTLWLSGRFGDVVYVFDTRTEDMTTIPVGKEPHQVAVWPPAATPSVTRPTCDDRCGIGRGPACPQSQERGRTPYTREEDDRWSRPLAARSWSWWR
jgi:hypothetical protein